MTPIRILLLFAWWSVSLWGAEKDLLRDIREVLLQPSGVGMDIQIQQVQYEKTFAAYGYVEILGPNRYYFDSDEQTILVEDKTIKTWNKAPQQLIIDTIIEDEFSLFQLLSGNFQALELVSVDSTAETITVSFSISEMSITGELVVEASSLQPIQIQFTYDENNLFIAHISNFCVLTAPTQFQQFQPQPKEVIDLRE